MDELQMPEIPAPPDISELLDATEPIITSEMLTDGLIKGFTLTGLWKWALLLLAMLIIYKIIQIKLDRAAMRRKHAAMQREIDRQVDRQMARIAQQKSKK